MSASYHMLVRDSFIGVVLNGCRMRHPQELTVAPSAAATSGAGSRSSEDNVVEAAANPARSR
jgi:hypothetical protein